MPLARVAVAVAAELAARDEPASTGVEPADACMPLVARTGKQYVPRDAHVPLAGSPFQDREAFPA